MRELFQIRFAVILVSPLILMMYHFVLAFYVRWGNATVTSLILDHSFMHLLYAYSMMSIQCTARGGVCTGRAAGPEANECTADTTAYRGPP